MRMLRGQFYWSSVRSIILCRCRRKGLPMNSAIHEWAARVVERQEERWRMRLALAVQV